jgi:hypothetical protein
MKKIAFTFLILSVTMSVIFLSCKKDKSEEDTDINSTADNSNAENIANDISIIGNQALDNLNNTISTYKLGIDQTNDAFVNTCASSVIVDTVVKKVTVTFNNSICADGRVRSGSLIFDYSQSLNGATKYRMPGFKCNVTALNYKVDGNLVTINSKSIQNTTASNFNPQSTNLTWVINSNLSITKTDGSVVTWICTRNKTLLNTSDTNVYRGNNKPIVWALARVGITGSASGVTAQGINYNAVITSQLIRDFTCSPNVAHVHRHPFIQGILEFTPEGKLTRRINYGSGTCDQEATVSIGNFTKTITLP